MCRYGELLITPANGRRDLIRRLMVKESYIKSIACETDTEKHLTLLTSDPTAVSLTALQNCQHGRFSAHY